MEIKDIGSGYIITRVPNGMEAEFKSIFDSIVMDFVSLESNNTNADCKKIRAEVAKVIKEQAKKARAYVRNSKIKRK